jgi:arylsulfatase A-like enzyme
VQTRSLVALLNGAAARVRDSIYLAYSTDATGKIDGELQPRGHLRGVRNGRWKLIRSDFAGHQQTLMFDLATDPWETRNLASDPTKARHLARMTRLLSQWSRRSGDPYHSD